MAEKGFRTFRCSNEECGKTVRFSVSEKSYGKTGIVRCTDCKTEHRITIPMPAPEPAPRVEPGSSAFDDLFGDIFGKKPKSAP